MSRATVGLSSLAAAPKTKGTVTHPVYMINTCWMPNINSRCHGSRVSTG